MEEIEVKVEEIEVDKLQDEDEVKVEDEVKNGDGSWKLM